MQERIEIPTDVTQSEKETQISIAVQKSLFKLDNAIISYHLLKKQYPEWVNLPNIQLEGVTKNIYSIWDNIEKALDHPLSSRFYKICEQYDTPFLIVGDIVSADPQKSKEILENPQVLEKYIRRDYLRRLQGSKSKTSRAAIYSTISIFITKILLALAVEIPFDRYVTGLLDWQVIGLSVAIPPSLMFFLVLTIRPPRKENLEKVVLETMKIVYGTEKKDVYRVKPIKKRGVLFHALITLFYLITFLVSFGLIWWGLSKLNFGILSIIIFIIFLSLIAFAGNRIRERAKELLVEEEKGNFFTFVLDSFSLPFIKLGERLSGEWTKYNIVLIFIIAFFDFPFQFFTELLEQWRYFLKEKKDEIH